MGGSTKDLQATSAAKAAPKTPRHHHQTTSMKETAQTPEPGRWRHALASVEGMLREGKSVAGDLVLLQDYARLQRKLWDTRAGRLESQISQMKKESKMERKVEAARLNLLLGLEKQLAQCYYKEQLDEESKAADMESLQATLADKDATIADLNADVKRRRKEAKVAKKEILRLRREIEILRASAKEKDETIALLQLQAEAGGGRSQRRGEKKPTGSGSVRKPTGGISSNNSSGGGGSPIGPRASPASPEPGNQHHRDVDADGEGKVPESQVTEKSTMAAAACSVARPSGRMTKLESCSVVKNRRIPAKPLAQPTSLFSGNFKAPKLKTTSSFLVL